jgi:hypothetical protein
MIMNRKKNLTVESQIVVAKRAEVMFLELLLFKDLVLKKWMSRRVMSLQLQIL